MEKETLKALGNIEIVIPAKKVLDAIEKSANACAIREITPERLRILGLVIKAQNSLIRAFGEKRGYFRLVTDYRGKVKFFERYHKKKR